MSCETTPHARQTAWQQYPRTHTHMDINTGEVPQCKLRLRTRLSHCERLRGLYRATGSQGDINDAVWATNTGMCLIACGTGSRKAEVSQAIAALALQSLQKLIEWTLPERGESAGAFTDALGV
jgi:hypothetical protein